MNLKVQFTMVFILSAISIIGFGFLSILVSQDRIVHFDSTVISFVQGFESPILTSIMKFFTFVGSLPAIIVLSVLIMFFLYTVLKHRSELILFVAAILGSSILFRILKQIFQRERPNLHRLIEISSYSFPSGHATTAFAFYGVLAFLLWRVFSGLQLLFGFISDTGKKFITENISMTTNNKIGIFFNKYAMKSVNVFNVLQINN
ncbi:phosphatase PAP2 family protein [Priestia filamentosa]|uniref:phosphatase PAP2 family protein n=1 Tax=Priestia filamentosa TaxID=1402861 RepID=UPI003F5CEB24